VLVAGGTGRLGRITVHRLVDQGVTVRVLTRDRGRAERLGDQRVEIAEGDVRRPETLGPAVESMDVVVSAVHGFTGPGRVSPRTVDRDGNAHLVAAAQQAGAAVVMVSVVGAAPDSPMELFREKYAAEQVVQASGLPWTIVRATAFAELWADLVGRGLVLGRGDNPINFVSVDDVAALLVRVVNDPAYRGRVLEIGGPRDVSLNELATILHEVGRAPATVWHLPQGILRAMAPLHRLPRAALVMDTTDLTFRPGADGQVGPTDVRKAVGRPASSTPRS
jgi:NADH dehydrogenase